MVSLLPSIEHVGLLLVGVDSATGPPTNVLGFEEHCAYCYDGWPASLGGWGDKCVGSFEYARVWVKILTS